MATPPVVPLVAKPQRAAGWLGRLTRRFCPARERCERTRCWLQPVCACARADLAAERQQESRFWIALGGCGLVLIILALLLW